MAGPHGRRCIGLDDPAAAHERDSTVGGRSKKSCVPFYSPRPTLIPNTDTSTADIAGLAAAAGLLTARGGRTSHAAVVARQLNKVCIVGCRGLTVQENGQRCRIGEQFIEKGATVSLDGQSGRVYSGKVDVIVVRPTQFVEEVERWKARCSQKGALQ